MKKFFSLLLVCILLFPNMVIASAQKIAVKSDIKAYIDYTPVKSYNVDGYTYVIAEELRHYGFDVIWNNDERTLKIERKVLETPIYTKKLFDADSDPILSKYQLYHTDIKTYLNGIEANSFNIGGQTIIQIDELSNCGYFQWDNQNREVRIEIYKKELELLYTHAENKQEIINNNDTIIMSYMGQLNEKGKPGGIGLMTVNEMSGSAGVSYTKKDSILGYFKEGKPYGKIFLERHLGAGKTGESISIKFIGEINSFKSVKRDYELNAENQRIESIIRENNFGDVSIPHYYMRNYMSLEEFADTNTYLNGVWFENNGYRGQTGVTFRSWYNSADYQSILKTDFNTEHQPIITMEEIY